MTQACRVCGCTNFSACEGGCWWIEDDLCSACVDVDEADPALGSTAIAIPTAASSARNPEVGHAGASSGNPSPSSRAPRRCSTIGCERTPAPNWAMCEACVDRTLYGPPPARVPLIRLSRTDPVSLALAGEISARSGR